MCLFSCFSGEQFLSLLAGPTSLPKPKLTAYHIPRAVGALHLANDPRQCVIKTIPFCSHHLSMGRRRVDHSRVLARSATSSTSATTRKHQGLQGPNSPRRSSANGADSTSFGASCRDRCRVWVWHVPQSSGRGVNCRFTIPHHDIGHRLPTQASSASQVRSRSVTANCRYAQRL